MCWNADVSLNTFLFSGFILLLIIYNNTFTKYKIQIINNVWAYLFVASVIFMQLIEYLIWKNINNPFYNNLFSIFGSLLLVIQPMASLMLLTNIPLRNLLLIIYLIIVIPFSTYKFSISHIHSVISKNGHLTWKFLDGDLPWSFLDKSLLQWSIWLFFFLFSFAYEQKWLWIICLLGTLAMSFINYWNDNTVGSMWCWMINSLMIYYAFYLLLYLPFVKN